LRGLYFDVDRQRHVCRDDVPDCARHLAREESETHGKVSFSSALMLGVAYSATLGGLGTLIGTPTNLILVALWRSCFRLTANYFFTWLKSECRCCSFPARLLLYLIRHFRISGNLSGGGKRDQG